MTIQAHDTLSTSPARLSRRADAGSDRLSQRDIDGLLLCGEHYGAPADLLAAADEPWTDIKCEVGCCRAATSLPAGRVHTPPGRRS